MKQNLKRAAALFLTAVLLCSSLAPAALASEGGDTVHIQSAGDLTALAQACTLDSWSQGKTVVLDSDVDVSGSGFASIPTFGGTFDGHGHTISGLSITGSGDTRGLFRYIQSGGSVKNLTVTGTINPSGRQDVLGGIVGSNRGAVSNCSFSGTITGKNSVGGIAGINQEGGQIVNCSFSGALTGEHYAGGIAGQNFGSLIQCENTGSVNITEVKSTVDRETLDLEQPNNIENAPVCTDIGGVAGFSSGIIQGCSNAGDVGYAHVGYNVGGIAGRQSGYLDGCSNTGAVRGRKDVGGIVGQMEPEVIEAFRKDFLDQLLEELDTLMDLMDRSLYDADGVADAISQEMYAVSDQTRIVQDTATGLMDAVTDWTNGTIGQINDLTARLSWTLDQMDPILDQAVDALKDLRRAANRLSDALDDANDAAGLGGDALDEMRRGLDSLQSSIEDLENICPNVRRAISNLRGSLGDPEASLDALLDLVSALNGFQSAMRNLQNGLFRLSGSLDTLGDAGEELTDAMDDMMDAGEILDGALRETVEIADDLSGIVHELSEMPDIQFSPIDETITDQGDALDASLTALLDQADHLNEVMTSSTDTLLADFQAISRQLRVILNLMRNEKQAQEDKGSLSDRVEDQFVDVSDQVQDSAQTPGRLSASQNGGTVEGDINAAGIVGSMAIEYDFDPEDDLTDSGSRSLDVRYQAKAVVLGCVNRGTVTGKENYAGGIVGRMDLGRVSGCQDYGPVSSTDGSYVGGIAGASYGVIRSCWAKCALSGEDYVGGIAGLGSTLSDCHTLITMTGGEAYLGAVAGSIEDDGSLSGNTFTQETLGGVDGISYAGKAEPVSFDTLCTTQGVPELFAQLELTFTADGKTVAVVPFQYGEGIERLPEIPAKKGYSAAWPDLDYSHLTASQTLEAVYTPYRSALSDGGELPEILVDGSFSKDAAVSHTTEEVTWTDEKGNEYTADAVTVTVKDPAFLEISYTVHYRLPQEGGRYLLWVQNGESWEQTDYETDGSYLLVGSQWESITFCLTQAPPVWPILAAVLAAAVLVIVLFAAVWVRKKKRSALPPR